MNEIQCTISCNLEEENPSTDAIGVFIIEIRSTNYESLFKITVTVAELAPHDALNKLFLMQLIRRQYLEHYLVCQFQMALDNLNTIFQHPLDGAETECFQFTRISDSPYGFSDL